MAAGAVKLSFEGQNAGFFNFDKPIFKHKLDATLLDALSALRLSVGARERMDAISYLLSKEISASKPKSAKTASYQYLGKLLEEGTLIVGDKHKSVAEYLLRWGDLTLVQEAIEVFKTRGELGKVENIIRTNINIGLDDTAKEDLFNPIRAEIAESEARKRLAADTATKKANEKKTAFLAAKIARETAEKEARQKVIDKAKKDSDEAIARNLEKARAEAAAVTEKAAAKVKLIEQYSSQLIALQVSLNSPEVKGDVTLAVQVRNDMMQIIFGLLEEAHITQDSPLLKVSAAIPEIDILSFDDWPGLCTKILDHEKIACQQVVQIIREITEKALPLVPALLFNLYGSSGAPTDTSGLGFK